MVVCEVCGGKLTAQSGGGTIVCENCGVEYARERILELMQQGQNITQPSQMHTAEPAATTSATVHLYRDKDSGCGGIRLTAFIDGKEFAQIKHSQTVQAILPEGKHVIDFQNVYGSFSLPIVVEHNVESYKVTCTISMMGKLKAHIERC